MGRPPLEAVPGSGDCSGAEEVYSNAALNGSAFSNVSNYRFHQLAVLR
jgi:hypothetical protein